MTNARTTTLHRIRAAMCDAWYPLKLSVALARNPRLLV
jgi:hypothetical protein